jgi:hypothetical protein
MYQVVERVGTGEERHREAGVPPLYREGHQGERGGRGKYASREGRNVDGGKDDILDVLPHSSIIRESIVNVERSHCNPFSSNAPLCSFSQNIHIWSVDDLCGILYCRNPSS